MRRTRWVILLAALALAMGGCEREKAPEAPRQVKPAEEKQAMAPPAEEKKEAAPPAAEEKKAMTPAEKTALPEVGKKIEEAAAQPPLTVTFDASMGKVTFDHQGHSGRLACDSCHPTVPPAKIPLGKDKAHQLCKGCHQEKGAGPTQCDGCHKKG